EGFLSQYQCTETGWRRLSAKSAVVIRSASRQPQAFLRLRNPPLVEIGKVVKAFGEAVCAPQFRQCIVEAMGLSVDLQDWVAFRAPQRLGVLFAGPYGAEFFHSARNGRAVIALVKLIDIVGQRHVGIELG